MNNLNKLEFSNIDIFMRATNISGRIFQEQASLHNLQKRNDFLSKYNMALRFMFIHILENKYDIKNRKVHKGFLFYCIHILGFDSLKIKEIIYSRHNLKYKGRPPSMQAINALDELLLIIRQNKYV